MRAITNTSIYWQGVRDGSPFLLVVCPFALLFGVIATEAGLNVFETLAFAVIVIAGAAQLTALQLMADDVPTVIVLVSALAVNLRMAMYSASLAPHLGAAPLRQRAIAAYFTIDQSYALSIQKFEQHPEMTITQRMRYFFGVVTLIVPGWYVATAVGALAGKSIPPEFALDFAVPITFLAMIAPMLRTMPHILAAGTSVVMALIFAGLPFNLGLLVAGFGAMIVGAQSELWFGRRAARKDAS